MTLWVPLWTILIIFLIILKYFFLFFFFPFILWPVRSIGEGEPRLPLARLREGKPRHGLSMMRRIWYISNHVLIFIYRKKIIRYWWKFPQSSEYLNPIFNSTKGRKACVRTLTDRERERRPSNAWHQSSSIASILRLFYFMLSRLSHCFSLYLR